MRAHAVVLALLCGCAGEPTPETGVDVYSADTSAARVSIVVGGSLEVGLQADRMYTMPDRSVVLETPLRLVFQEGDGDVFVASVDSSQRIVVQPFGVPQDSAEAAGVMGTIVSATRVAGDRRPRLKVEKP